MARTYKDRPYRLRYPHRHRDDYVVYKEVPWLQTTHWQWSESKNKSEELPLPFPVWRVTTYKIPGPTTKRKLQRHESSYDYSWHRRTPSWYTNLFMNRPQRRAGRVWERVALFEDVETTDPPGVSRKPHKYYH